MTENTTSSDTTMTDASTDDGDDTAEATAPSSDYRLAGTLDADTGVAVLGRNTASSGTPVGVEGVAPEASDGYGLSTPDDTRIAGTAQLGALGGPLTDGTVVSDLIGVGLTVDSGTLSVSATGGGVTIDDGDTTVATVDTITFGSGMTVTDDGNGAVTVDRR